MKKLFISCIVLLLFSHLACAAVESPTNMLSQIINDTLLLLKKQQVLLESKKISQLQHYDNVYDGLKVILEPHVDKDLMASQMLGRAVWNQATASQKQDFVLAFEHLLTYTYSSALTSHTDSKIIVLPLDKNVENQQFVSVVTKVTTINGPDVFVKYHLIKNGNQWHIYDLSIQDTGISMVQSYKSQFAPYTRKEGIVGATNLVENVNKRTLKKLQAGTDGKRIPT